ncbi:MAG: Stk1 family PASTA domain-containing Ser/Thr kinase [Mogibacterium sp.]|nr:Stk1 family PASTA domain-containing Ser/Thr kinase [Mogibacterium sp.]MBR2540088.1 Stk1 family PASTA domain-containing Ser/Thr kinase [Mogibacterium sp.]
MSSRLLSGRYELLEKIGDGGMAVVYKGKDRLLNRFIAIKILRPEFTKDATFVENFKRESQAAAGLTHPNIVGVYDVGREGNINYIVMELIEGRTLNAIIEDEAPMDYKKVIDISKQVASALRIAHKNKIIHRDVKPHNIMITNDGVVKLADFGIARAVNDATLSTGSKIVGSVHYFSPEQARGNYVDERSDIYSLGIVMYEMLTGQVPFDGENPVTVALKHINEEIRPPSELVDGIPPALERCVMKATNKYQTNRYSSADELIEELDNISFVTNVAGTEIFAATDVIEKRNKRKAELEAAREEEEPKKKKKKTARDKRLTALIIILVVLLAIFAGWFIAWRMGVFSSTKPAPDFLDKTIDEAQAIAEEEGFILKQGKDIYSNDYTENRICLQDPAPGAEAPKGGTITVNVSKGSKEGMVPNVVGMQRDEVEDFLAQYGYVLGNVKVETSPEDEGKVLEQDPVAGSPLDKESKVNIVVSDGKGTEKGTVPSVTNLSLKEAKKAIQSAGFEVGRVDYDWSNSVDKGYVMYQQYQANSLLDKGTSIDIQVSSGPEPAPVVPETPATETPEAVTPAEGVTPEQPAEGN